MKNIKVENKEIIFMFVKVVLTIATIIVSAYVAVLLVMILLSAGIYPVFAYIAIVVLPSLRFAVKMKKLLFFKEMKEAESKYAGTFYGRHPNYGGSYRNGN